LEIGRYDRASVGSKFGFFEMDVTYAALYADGTAPSAYERPKKLLRNGASSVLVDNRTRPNALPRHIRGW